MQRLALHALALHRENLMYLLRFLAQLLGAS